MKEYRRKVKLKNQSIQLNALLAKDHLDAKKRKTGDSQQQNEKSNSQKPTPTFRQYVKLRASGVRQAEAGQLDAALETLSRAVEAAPSRPGAYNDRAQLLRLMQRDDEAMSDLDLALELSAGQRSRARALALCQRGVLLRKRGEDDAARASFAEAAKLGSGFAKKQVVELNPYAALCNQMLSQVMKGDKDIKL